MKNINFTAMKVLFFKKVVDINKVLVCNKISSGQANYKYFIGYLYDDYKIRPLYVMLPNTSVHAESYDSQTK